MRILSIFVLLLLGCNDFKSLSNLSFDNNQDQDIPEVGTITPEIGGSNYAFIELGRYAQNPTDENWASDVKTPIVHFHEHVQKVQEQLDFFVQNNQRKISLIVWFGGPNQTCQTWLHTVCPQNGKLPELVKNNLQSLLREILKRPFKEIQIRLAGQGTADLHAWTQWEEEIFQSNQKFILDVIDKSEEVLLNSNTQIYYDLGLELMGHAHIERSWYKNYIQQIWLSYIDKYSVDKTIGFSFNHANRNAVYESLKIFDDSGKRPPRLGIDVYTNRQKVFENLSWVLDLMGWGKDYPIFIQETYRNDSLVAQDILNARQNLGLNILTIMQWPLDQNGPGHSNSTDYNFELYR